MEFQLNIITKSYKRSQMWNCYLRMKICNSTEKHCSMCPIKYECLHVKEAPEKVSLWAGAMPKEIGLDMFDIIKEQYPDVTTQRVYNEMSCPCDQERHIINITEDTARKSGRFGGSSVREIEVSEGYMVKYLREVFKPNYHEETQTVKSFFGRIKSQIKISKLLTVTIELKVDNEAFINDWATLGYPLKMGV